MNVCLIYNISRGRELVGVVELMGEMSYNDIVDRFLARHGLTTKSRDQFVCDMSPVISHESLMKFDPIAPEYPTHTHV